MERLKKPTKVGISTNGEDWIVESELEFGMDQVWDDLKDSIWISPGEECSFTVWIGKAAQHNAAWYLNQAATGWSDWEERAEEIFYDESLAEIEKPLGLDEKGLRPQFYAEIERFCHEMCAKLGIEINYYEIQDVEKFDGRFHWPHERDEPEGMIKIGDEWFRSD
jgi:hypothetical protein